MATQTTVTLVDDLDGTPAVETIEFGLDGSSYEIDLNDKNAKKLRDVLASFVGSARVANSASGRRRGSAGNTRPAKSGRSTTRSAPDREQTAAIRAWAKRNGHTVSDRGRLSSEVIEAFESAH